MDRFDLIFKYILKVEGGYSNDKNDKGGETKYGIIKEEARRNGYYGAMKDLPLSFAKEVFRKKYYNKYFLDEIKDDRVALSITDWVINSGIWALKKAQSTLNELGFNLVVDGKFGNKTLETLNTVDPNKFLSAYHRNQRQFYRNIVAYNPTQKEFLQGWLNRVERKEDFIAENYSSEVKNV